MKIIKFFMLLIVGVLLFSCDDVTSPVDDVPINLEINQFEDNKIELSWSYNNSSSSDIIEFHISKKVGEEVWNDNFRIVDEDNFSTIDQIPTNDILVYAYKVRIYNNTTGEFSNFSETIAYLSENTYPLDMIFEQISQGEIIVSWTDNCVGDDGYKVDRKLGDGIWIEEYKILPGNTFSFTDIVTLYDSLFYRIYAYVGISETGTVEGTVFNSLPAPSNLECNTLDINKIRLDWTDNSIGEDGFYIDRKTGSQDWVDEHALVDSNISTYVDDILLPCGTLQYRVRAFKDDFSSNYSNVDTINVHLQIVGSVDTPGSALDICLPRDNNFIPDWTAFIADNYGGLAIIDCFNPNAPQYSFSYPLADRTLSSFVDLNFAYVTTHSGLSEFGEIQKIDVTNLQEPIITGVTETTGIPKDIIVDQDYAYIAEGDNGVTIMYIASSEPVEVSNFPLQDARNVFIRENDTYLFIANGLYGMTILDVADPNNPQLIYTHSTTGLVNEVYVFGNYAFLANGENGLEILDISDVSNTLFIDIIETGGFINGVFAEQNYVYITDSEKGFYVIDVANPYSAFILGHVQLTSAPKSIYLSGSYIYITDDEGLKIIQVKE